MGYFRIEMPRRILRYPFDYHSHFSGILPVQAEHDDKKPHRRPPDHPTLAGLLSEAYYPQSRHKQARGELRLFDYALQFMEGEKTNPLSLLWYRANRVEYERAEAAAENIYLAAVILGYRASVSPLLLGAPAHRPELYRAIRERVVEPALRSEDAPSDALIKLVRYFNGKIYSSNKYTPFDDCYKMRGDFVKRFCGGDPARFSSWDANKKRGNEDYARYKQWIVKTFDFLHAEGITHTQTAATEDELKELSAQATTRNQPSIQYKLLAHTPHQYWNEGELRKYLETKILPTLTNADCAQIVGLDLLGAENKVGNYVELLGFLKGLEEANGPTADKLKENFGANGARARKMTVHIHCGEGSGFGSTNRSMIGNFLYEVGTPRDVQGFYFALRDHVLQGYHAAEESLAAATRNTRGAPRGTRGTRTPLGLFDKLFHDNTLTWQGATLRRFDISSERSRELAAYNAKRNVMALSEVFDAKAPEYGESWYKWLTTEGKRYAIRLGHAYYYRQYFAAKYPAVAFDTNLGSNAITGASGLFNSIESYRGNRGLRHLDGYIDTNVLQSMGNAVAYMGTDALTTEQIDKLTEVSRKEGELTDALDMEKQWFSTQLARAWGGIRSDKVFDYGFDKYRQLVSSVIAEDAPVGVVRYQVLSRTLALFQNWRSYLLGADGQGAEHTDIQREFLRMLIILIYGLLPAGQESVGRNAIASLQNVVELVGRLYWLEVCGKSGIGEEQHVEENVELIDGFKAPDSVVAVRRRLEEN